MKYSIEQELRARARARARARVSSIEYSILKPYSKLVFRTHARFFFSVFRGVERIYLSRAIHLNMFDFEKMEVYRKSVRYFNILEGLGKDDRLHYYIKDQLYRAGLSVVINIAEGSGRRTRKDKRHFFVISRGSVFETVAILGILKNKKLINNEQYEQLYLLAEELSKMLLSLIRYLE